jgi:hypothetical protein
MMKTGRFWRSCRETRIEDVLPDGPTSRGAATSWLVYLVSLMQTTVVLPLVGMCIMRPILR